VKRRLPAILFALTVAGVAAFSSGPPDGSTGAPGEILCTACHTGAPANSGAGSLTITGLPDAYEPGASYTLTLTLSDPNARRWGFQATAKTAVGPAGAITATDTLTTLVSQTAGFQYIKQTFQGTFQNTTGSASWSFDWTAPEPGSGPVTFYAAGNAANFDGSPLGDLIYNISLVTPEAQPLLRGDLNGDGIVNISDVIIALRIAVGFLEPTPEQILLGDVAPKPGLDGRPFGDGVVDIRDVTRILRRSVSLEPDPWP
jgi:hypothetical protein